MARIRALNQGTPGAITTASNQGAAGVGPFLQKTGSDLEFKNINAGSSKVTVTDDVANNEIDIDVDESVLDHGNLAGLGDDDHTQYVLLAGRSGGQYLYGGTGSGDDLTIESTSNATKGSIIFKDTNMIMNDNQGSGIIRVKGSTDPNFFVMDTSAETFSMGPSGGGATFNVGANFVGGWNAFNLVNNDTGTGSYLLFNQSTGVGPTHTILATASNFSFAGFQSDLQIKGSLRSSLRVDSNNGYFRCIQATNEFFVIRTLLSGTTGTAFLFTCPANTSLTASTESIDTHFNLSSTKTFATGAITNQRAFLISPPTYAFAGASTITNAYTMYITGAPTAGANATITNSWALYVAAGDSRFANFTGTTGKVGDATNNSEFESDGTLVFNGNATVWEDLRVPVTATRTAGVRDPDFIQFTDNGAGSTGVFTYHFSPTTEEELFFVAQVPHSYKEGTDIVAHVHWAPINANAGNVVWGLEYTWANVDSALGNTTLSTATDAASGVANQHQVINVATISGTRKTISSMLVCRIYRDAANAADTYGSDASLLEIDFHFEQDTVGSRQITSK